LSISDNGCGLQEGHVTAPSSFGMRGMRERVGQLEGEISFDTPPGGGMRVTVRVPMSANMKARA
jgi:two-component system sensor histidine kinase UhpB